MYREGLRGSNTIHCTNFLTGGNSGLAWELPHRPRPLPGRVFTAAHPLSLLPTAIQAAAEQRPQVLRHQGPARIAVLLHWSAAQAPPLGGLSTQVAAAGNGRGVRLANMEGGGMHVEKGRKA
jgi:hypothetical protein